MVNDHTVNGNWHIVLFCEIEEKGIHAGKIPIILIEYPDSAVRQITQE
jgi:hypothetical protein